MTLDSEPPPEARPFGSSADDRRGRFWTWPRLVTLGSGAALALLLGLSSGARGFVLTSGRYLIELDIPGLRDYLHTFGSYAWVISSILMILQSLAAPIPAVPITLTNALIYGPWLGALISWGSAQVAAVLCFFIARSLGRPFVERLFSRGAVERFDRFFKRYGILAILVARLIPVVSFDIVSYGAGLTSLRVLPFFLATGLGQLPATIVYSHAGAELATSPSRSATLVLWFVGLTVLVIGVIWARQQWRKRKTVPPTSGS